MAFVRATVVKLGNDRCDDSSADSSASLAQCCRYGGIFFPAGGGVGSY